MLCSGTELGLNEDLYPGWLQRIAGSAGGCGNWFDVKELTGLNDWIFDVSITANRPTARVFLVWQERCCRTGRAVKTPALDWHLRQKLRKKAST